jgi:hypothetical protein
MGRRFVTIAMNASLCRGPADIAPSGNSTHANANERLIKPPWRDGRMARLRIAARPPATAVPTAYSTTLG